MLGGLLRLDCDVLGGGGDLVDAGLLVRLQLVAEKLGLALGKLGRLSEVVQLALGRHHVVRVHLEGRVAALRVGDEVLYGGVHLLDLSVGSDEPLGQVRRDVELAHLRGQAPHVGRGNVDLVLEMLQLCHLLGGLVLVERLLPCAAHLQDGIDVVIRDESDFLQLGDGRLELLVGAADGVGELEVVGELIHRACGLVDWAVHLVEFRVERVVSLERELCVQGRVLGVLRKLLDASVGTGSGRPGQLLVGLLERPELEGGLLCAVLEKFVLSRDVGQAAGVEVGGLGDGLELPLSLGTGLGSCLEGGGELGGVAADLDGQSAICVRHGSPCPSC